MRDMVFCIGETLLLEMEGVENVKYRIEDADFTIILILENGKKIELDAREIK